MQHLSENKSTLNQEVGFAWKRKGRELHLHNIQ